MKRTRTRVTITALGCLVVGIVAIWISTAIAGSGGVVLATFGTIVITIGVVNMISDFFLQKSVSDDLISLIQSDRRLIEAGLDGISRVDDTDWAGIATSDYSLAATVLEPSQFRNIIWPRILDAAKNHLSGIEIVVVDPDTSDLAHLAKRAGLDSQHYADALRALVRDIEVEWKAMKSQSLSKCTIEIRQTVEPPRYGFVRTDQVVALILEPLSRDTGHNAAHALIFRTKRKGNSYAKWLTDSIAALGKESSAPLYSDRRINAAIDSQGL